MPENQLLTDHDLSHRMRATELAVSMGGTHAITEVIARSRAIEAYWNEDTAKPEPEPEKKKRGPGRPRKNPQKE